jgi:hypothetical protein
MYVPVTVAVPSVMGVIRRGKSFAASIDWRGKTYSGTCRRTEEDAHRDLLQARQNIAQDVRPFPQFKRKHGDIDNNPGDSVKERRKDQDMEGDIIRRLIREHGRQHSEMQRVRDACRADDVFLVRSSHLVADQVKTCRTTLAPGKRCRAHFKTYSSKDERKYDGMLVTCVDTRDDAWWLLDGSKVCTANVSVERNRNDGSGGTVGGDTSDALLECGVGIVSLVAARIRHAEKAHQTTLEAENMRSTVNYRKEYAMEVLISAVFRDKVELTHPFRENDVCDQIRRDLATQQILKQQNKVVYHDTRYPGFQCGLNKSQCRIGQRKQLKQPYAVGDNDVYTFAYWDMSDDTPWALVWDIPESAPCVQHALQSEDSCGKMIIRLHVPSSINLPPDYQRFRHHSRITPMALDTMQHCRKLSIPETLTEKEYSLFRSILKLEE